MAALFISASSHAAWQTVASGECSSCPPYLQSNYEPAGYAWRSLPTTGISCNCQIWNPANSSPCTEPEIWNQTNSQCEIEVDCSEFTGQDAGIDENASSPPGYGYLCYSDCAVEVSEYFQRIDNGNWVIAYRYTGQECGGSGDPLAEPTVPPGDPGPDPIDTNQTNDTDNDGTPNYNDSDIDGDGIPNSTDTDIDGDGIDNSDDPTPNGTMGTKDQEASQAITVDNCQQRPSCSGDAIQCAQLMEIWRLRCKSENTRVDYSQSDIDSILEGVNNENQSLLDQYEQDAIHSIEEHNQIEFNNAIKDKVLEIFPSVSCSDMVIPWENPVVIKCSDTSMIRVATLFIATVLAILALWHIATKEVK